MEKNKTVKRVVRSLVVGLCLWYGGISIAGSVTVSGTTGTNPTYIVISTEYAGKEGQFVATGSSSNSSSTSYGSPSNDGSYVYMTKTRYIYGTLSYSLTTPSSTSQSGSSITLSSLEKGSYTVTVEQSLRIMRVSYTLYKSYWADTENETYSDMIYYAQNGTLPASAGISQAPTTISSTSSSTTTSGVTVSSAYIVVYGVDDDSSGDTSSDDDDDADTGSSGSTNITITIGSDDGVYTLISSLFSYISEIQTILSASDEQIRSELLSYITELQTAYQAADTELATTIQNQITALETALSTDISDLKTSLEAEITDLEDQISLLQSSITENSDDIEALEDSLAELKSKLEALELINDQTIEDIIEKINAGDEENAEALENMKVVLEIYCDTIKDELGDRISSLEETVSALQTALEERIQTLEDRLTYSLMTDEELESLVESKQNTVNSLANQIAALNLTIEEYEEAGNDTTDLEEQLSSLTVEYDAANNDLVNIQYVIELRSTSELALHRKWIEELQELVASLQVTVSEQGETILQQAETIEELQTTIANLEQALEDEIEALKAELTEYVDSNVTDINNEIADLTSQIQSLRDNITTLATSSYSSDDSSSSSTYDYSGTSSDTIEDTRDLRTSDSTALDF